MLSESVLGGDLYEEEAYEPKCDDPRHDVCGYLKGFGDEDPFVELDDGDLDQR